MPSPVRFVAEHIWLLLLAVTLGCFTGCDKDELKALREANRIAEDARRDQAEQTRSFAELEATLSQERQNIDRERAQAAQRHDEAARSREQAIQAQREANEAAARDKFLGQALLACAPLLTVQAFYRAINALALRRGHNPDLPPHLNKVTETV